MSKMRTVSTWKKVVVVASVCCLGILVPVGILMIQGDATDCDGRVARVDESGAYNPWHSIDEATLKYMEPYQLLITGYGGATGYMTFYRIALDDSQLVELFKTGLYCANGSSRVIWGEAEFHDAPPGAFYGVLLKTGGHWYCLFWRYASTPVQFVIDGALLV